MKTIMSKVKSIKFHPLALSLFTALLLVIVFAAIWFSRPVQEPFPPSGGEVFSKKVLMDVPLFLQNDGRWAADEIGNSGSRMGNEGCAVASVAMLLNYYGIEADPQKLNKYLTDNKGYTDRGWIYWNKVVEMTSGKAKLAYVGSGSYEIIDKNLKDKNPVIVKILIGNTIPHWVLIVGKQGREYLINDPLSKDKKVRNLSEYDSDIYAVRLYRTTYGSPASTGR